MGVEFGEAGGGFLKGRRLCSLKPPKEMAENGAPLLERMMYYESCPGCKLERRKEERRGIPYKEFLYAWIVTLCTGEEKLDYFWFLDWFVLKS